MDGNQEKQIAANDKVQDLYRLPPVKTKPNEFR
jgi:hypothetical protein